MHHLLAQNQGRMDGIAEHLISEDVPIRHSYSQCGYVNHFSKKTRPSAFGISIRWSLLDMGENELPARGFQAEENMRKLSIASLMFLGLVVMAPTRADAGTIVTFDVTWSGAPYGNSAMASGTVTLDLSLINNPGTTMSDAALIDASVTVTGASSGNGTFSGGDFYEILLDTHGDTLDFTTQLIGQSGPGGTYGVDTGNFNLYATSLAAAAGAPDAAGNFTLTTNAGYGDSMLVTSIAPVASVPEPSTLVLGTIAGLAGLGLTWRRRTTAV